MSKKIITAVYMLLFALSIILGYMALEVEQYLVAATDFTMGAILVHVILQINEK